MTYNADLSRRVGRACQASPLADLSWGARYALAERVEDADSFNDLSAEDQSLVLASERSKPQASTSRGLLSRTLLRLRQRGANLDEPTP